MFSLQPVYSCEHLFNLVGFRHTIIALLDINPRISCPGHPVDPMAASLLSRHAKVLATDLAQFVEANIPWALPHPAEGFLNYASHNNINNDTILSRGSFAI
jgi:hypothetical protein